jgi:hypothetical protein
MVPVPAGQPTKVSEQGQQQRPEGEADASSKPKTLKSKDIMDAMKEWDRQIEEQVQKFKALPDDVAVATLFSDPQFVSLPPNVQNEIRFIINQYASDVKKIEMLLADCDAEIARMSLHSSKSSTSASLAFVPPVSASVATSSSASAAGKASLANKRDQNLPPKSGPAPKRQKTTVARSASHDENDEDLMTAERPNRSRKGPSPSPSVGNVTPLGSLSARSLKQISKVVVLSDGRVAESKLKILEGLSSSLTSRVATLFSSEVTVVVTKCNNQMETVPSETTMLAYLHQTPIVRDEWIIYCNAEGMWLPVDAFIASTVDLQKTVEDRVRSSASLLNGLSFSLFGLFGAQVHDALRVLIPAIGGKIVDAVEPENPNFFIVADPHAEGRRSIRSFGKETGAKCVNYRWIMDSIIQRQKLNQQSYVI